jgi:ADP-ribose pyrophosphatase
MSPALSQFRKLAEETVYQGEILNLVVGTYEAPDGAIFRREKIDHLGAVVIVPVLDDGDEVLCVRQYRSAIEAEVLELPAGRLDVVGESPELAAARELKEEAGYRAGRYSLLCRFYSAPGYSDEVLWIYLAQDLEATATDRHGVEEEHMTIERVRLSDVAGLVASGAITDGKTIIGLFLAREVLGR